MGETAMENKIHGRSRFLAGAKRTIAGAMLLLLYGLVGGVPVFARPFPLTDSGPGSPAFRERFLASYGVNAAIEPTLGVEDRKLYERIAPYLHDDQARAIREVEAALAPDSNPAYRFLLGNLYYEAGDWEKSERYLREAIARFPDFRRAHRTLGLVLIQEGRYSEAVDTWLTVIRLGGGDAQSYGLLAYSRSEERRVGKECRFGWSACLCTKHEIRLRCVPDGACRAELSRSTVV